MTTVNLNAKIVSRQGHLTTPPQKQMITSFYNEIMIGRTRRQKNHIRLVGFALIVAVVVMLFLLASIIWGITQIS